jgi:hypothetical protein
MTQTLDLPDGAYDSIEIAATQAAILFRSLGWTWGRSDMPPTFREIKEKFQSLMETCIRENLMYAGGGRLMCYVYDSDAGGKNYTFCIECSSVIVENPHPNTNWREEGF